MAPFPCGTSPCIDPIFGPTAANFYWSSTTRTPTFPTDGWGVNFADGNLNLSDKDTGRFVRAVRGGL